MGFFAELKRRNVIRMAGLYLVGAWLVVQVAGTLLPVFEAPGWVMKTLVGLLAVGFVPAVVFSWVFELTPEGLKRDADVPAGQSIAPQTARRMDRTIIAVLLLALGYFAVDKFVLGRRVAPAEQASTAAAPPVAKSIAVLPFRAMSSGEDDGYFADGVTEEILTALSQLPDLLVTARTSAFHFKGKDVPVPEIARQLGVAHVLEGSVRRQGERVRITAQLIRAQDGFHLWSENYDRETRDTIAVQDEIAQRVAAVLNVLLDETRRAAMQRVAIGDVDAFVAYQKGLDLYQRAHLRRQNSDFQPLLQQSQVLLDQALASAPDLFPARLLRLDLYTHQLLDPLLYPGQTPLSPEQARVAMAALQEGNARALSAARSETEQGSAGVTRVFLSGDWTGWAAASARQFAGRDCVETLFNDASIALGLAPAAKAFYEGQIACNPLELENYWSLASALLWMGDYPGVLAIAGAQARQGERDWRLDWIVMLALAASGRGDEAEALARGVTGGSFANAAGYLALVAAIRGERSQALARWAALPASERGARLELDQYAWMGDREAASALAARIDGQTFGPVALAEITRHCYCGAPFDIERTPNFKARMAESGLPWPPKKPVPTPLKDW